MPQCQHHAGQAPMVVSHQDTLLACEQMIAKQSKQELLVNVLSRGGIRFVVIK